MNRTHRSRLAGGRNTKKLKYQLITYLTIAAILYLNNIYTSPTVVLKSMNSDTMYDYDNFFELNNSNFFQFLRILFLPPKHLSIKPNQTQLTNPTEPKHASHTHTPTDNTPTAPAQNITNTPADHTTPINTMTTNQHDEEPNIIRYTTLVLNTLLHVITHILNTLKTYITPPTKTTALTQSSTHTPTQPTTPLITPRYHHTGGGDITRTQPHRTARTPNIPVALSPPTNPLSLPIDNLPGTSLVVADSLLPGAGKGLFTLLSLEIDDLICTYSGQHLPPPSSNVPNHSPRYDYVWSNHNDTIIIDAYDPHSCYGRYANDAIHEHKCNAIITEHNGKSLPPCHKADTTQ
jgi:hypothetical protein